MASNLIKKKKTLTVYVKENATAEELKEVKRLVELGWVSKPCKPKAEQKEVVPHEVTKDFNISYDEVRKEDMYKYVKEFVTDEEKKKAFAVAAHSNIKGEMLYKEDKKNNTKIPKYNQIAAKQFFYKTFFPEKWKEIEKMLEERKFKSAKAKEKNEMENYFLDLMK